MNPSHTKMNPFPGLRPFTQEEDYLFFGREEQTLELLRQLASNRFLAVVGTSGSGKSSLVRCGLLSQLLGGKMLEAGAAWEIAITHPGGNPLALLTSSLLDAYLYDRDEEHARENLLATLSRSQFGLVEAVKQAGLGAGTNFLLVVDQFEEIFRFHEAGQMQQEAANEFVSLLLEAAMQKVVPIYVVMTMRSDFIGECGQFEGLAEMVNQGEFLIPRLNREQYKRVIEGPIKVAGGQIAPRLLQRLLNDLGQQADQLPCLQHALMRTWNIWSGNGAIETLDLDDYERVGKMSQALSLHADEIYHSLGSDRQRELCQGLFQALTVEELNSRGIRRPQRLSRLCKILDVSANELLPIIDAYRQSGVTLLMPSPEVELTDQTIIDISHESLMRVWTRLRQWVEEETQAAGIYRRLSESATLSEQGKAGLYRDPELGIALAWWDSKRPNAAWADRYGPGFLVAMNFLDASFKASVSEEQAREAARQRELEQAQQLAEAQKLRLEQQQHAARSLRRLMAGVAGVAVVACIACLAAVVANNKAQIAQRDTKKALDFVELQKAEVDASLKKTAEAERLAQIAGENTKKALAESQIVVADMRTNSGLLASDRGQSAEAGVWFASAAELLGADHPRSTHNSLRAALWNGLVPRPLHAVVHPEEWVMGTSFHPSGRFLMTCSPKIGPFRGLCAVWDLSKEQQLQLPLHAGLPTCGIWSQDGQTLAIGTDQGHVLLQDFPDGPTKHDLSMQDRIDFLEIDPTGRFLAVAYGQRTASMTTDREVRPGNKVRVWDMQASEFVTPELKQRSSISAVTFHPKGTQLLVGNHEGYYVAFGVPSTSDSPVSPRLKMQQYGPSIVVGERPPRPIYLDQGKQVLTLEPLQLWDTQSWAPLPLKTLPALPTKLQSTVLTTTPKGQIILAGLGGIRLLDSSTLQVQDAPQSTPRQYVFDVAVSPDGRQLLCGSSDRTARLYELPSATPIGPAITHMTSILDVSWSSDGQSFATAQRGGLVRVWAMPSNPLPVAELRPGGLASLSTSGRYVASSGSTQRQSGPRLTRVYSTADGSPAGPEIPTAGPLLNAAFSPDEKELSILAAGANSLSIVNWRTGKLRGKPVQMPSEPRSIRYHPAGDAIGVLCAAGQIVLVNPADLSVRLTWSNQVAYLPSNSYTDNGALCFGPDGDSLITYETDAFVRVWDWKASSLRYRLEGHRDRCSDIALSSDGELIATACRDNTARVWDFATGKAVSKSLIHPDWVYSVAFHPKRDLIITTCRDGQVRVWYWRTGDLFCSPFQHGHEVHAAAFTPDGRFALTASEDETARVWELQSGKPLTPPIPLGEAALNLEVSPDGRRLVVGGFAKSSMHIISLDALFDPDRLDIRHRRLSAELTASQGVESSGGLSNLSADQWNAAWKDIQSSRDSYVADLTRNSGNVFAGAPVYPSAHLKKRAANLHSQLQAGLFVEAVAEVADLAQNPNWRDVYWYNFACVYAIASSKILDKEKEYSDRAMDMLLKAVALGYKNAAQIEKDTDLDPIRKREDFQKLMVELAEIK